MANNLIRKLKKINKDFYSVTDLEKISGLKRKSLLVKLSRLGSNSEITRIIKGYYQTVEKTIDIEKFISQVYALCYVSFESALAKFGILNQIPYTLTIATAGKPKKIQFLNKEIEFRKLKKELFFGFELTDGIYIARPEKALLDQLYLVSKGKAVLDLDELNLKNLKRTLFLEYVKKYPKNTQELAKKIVENFGKNSITIK